MYLGTLVDSFESVATAHSRNFGDGLDGIAGVLQLRRMKRDDRRHTGAVFVDATFGVHVDGHVE